jgi:hypothetical protein
MGIVCIFMTVTDKNVIHTLAYDLSKRIGSAQGLINFMRQMTLGIPHSVINCAFSKGWIAQFMTVGIILSCGISRREIIQPKTAGLSVLYGA